MSDEFHVTVGERYRRHLAPHDYVWPRSCDGISVALITSSGAASMPVATFIKEFDPAPRRGKGKRS